MTSTLRADDEVTSSPEASADDTYRLMHEFLTRLMCSSDVETLDNLLETELTVSQFKAMAILTGKGRPVPLNELADALHLSLAATGRTIDKLVIAGFVDRREDEHDRRIKRISLTEQGRKEVAQHIDKKDDQLRDLVTRLPVELRTRFHDVLASVLDGEFLPFPGSALAESLIKKANHD
ncbi:MarR family winged helix-turn-helix transcriptional regulator [Williamsia sterculiae]|uniref:DNA-binding transcriptional regulator, MarR family n=1 Tax=Williamsia sterculiae TaxID=1344003 RepID=A0A1N7GYI6_9NOCA|nr:MarR family transcriptional regulator [Williamsia sterculiae]SIS17586.1 DNA-binding transcriptional regulator, MarR family [Williamsia sterculiae]